MDFFSSIAQGTSIVFYVPESIATQKGVKTFVFQERERDSQTHTFYKSSAIGYHHSILIISSSHIVMVLEKVNTERIQNSSVGIRKNTSSFLIL